MRSKLILFIDEVHTLMGAGGAEGAIDASNIIKPYLARGDIKVIGATTIKEYNDFIAKDKALDRRFQKVFIQEATQDEVLTIILKLRPIYEKFHNVILTNEILSSLVKLSFSCLFYGRQPDKTIDFLDEVCSYATIHKNNEAKQISMYHNKIREVEKLKNDEIRNQNFDKAIYYKTKEMELKSACNFELFEKKDFKAIEIDENDLHEVIYQKTRSPKPQEFLLKIRKFKKHMKMSFFGQDEIIQNVCNILSKYDYITNRKCLSFLFVGKSGLGKTFLLDKLLEYLFEGVNVISLQMGEYREAHSISKLVGTSPGYVGYQDCFIFQSIQENPFSILILEDIDKASSSVMNELFSAFSNGYISDSHGEKINLSKCMVFMTSSEVDQSIGFFLEKKSENISKYDQIENVFYFKNINENIVRKYLEMKLNSSSITEKEKIKLEILKKADWQKEGFRALNVCLEEEFVPI